MAKRWARRTAARAANAGGPKLDALVMTGLGGKTGASGIPIVFVSAGDPVGMGLLETLDGRQCGRAKCETSQDIPL
jgi:hypothetical protein